jgi:hypothetical protein
MTDWDKELAKIDKQLASISDDALLKSAQPVAPAKGAPARALPAGAPKSAAPQAGAFPAATVPGAGKPWVSWAKVLVAVAAAAGLMFWPWPARCGAPLVGFTAATGGVALLGLWSALGTWRHRLGLAHVASLLVTVWGLALGAREVLPRVGYAVPTAVRPGQWSCDGLPALPGNPGVTPGTDGTPSTLPVSPAPAGLLPPGRSGTTL